MCQTIICVGAVKDKCYADKPETIDALKDNIREAIGEIQLHTIDCSEYEWVTEYRNKISILLTYK